MSEPNSTPSVRPGKPAKPSKPYPEFPLTAHPTGYWCKTIRGKIHYFGPWDDPTAPSRSTWDRRMPCTRAARRDLTRRHSR